MLHTGTLLTYCLILAAAGNAHAQVKSADWPHWRGPDRTGVSPETGWESEGAEAPLWVAEVGRGYSASSIADGRLFTRGFFEREDKRGDDITICLDAATGEELWSHASPAELGDEMHGGGTLTTPVVDGDTVYVLSRTGPLWAFAAADGERRWETDLTLELEIETGIFGLSSSPLVLGDAVIVNVGKTAAYDKRTGKLRWATRDYGYSYGTPAPFEWQGEKLLAVFNAAGLTILEEATGAEIAVHGWTSEFNVNCSTPIVIGNRIFISTGYNEKGCALLELTDEGLALVWKSRAMNSLMNGCVLVDGLLYGFDKTKLKCLDLDGEQLWERRGLGRGAVIGSDGRLIVLSEEGELLVGPANSEGFEATYEAKVLNEGPCWTTPILAGGRIYCRSAPGQLVCRDHRAQD
ncbi:MAG: alcohol dehydrogenase [Planctomycetota bacterium]|nr:MAG: alcohol dehydrogenase [Planctomycetota bacterium]